MKRSVKHPGAKQMGRFAVEIELSNNRDLLKAEDGELPPQKVRRLRIRGIVHTAATRLVIPKMVAEQLGLP